MNDQQLRQIIRQEIEASNSSSRFGLNTIPRHTHNGIDSPQISANDVIAGNSVEGSIAFAQVTTYNIGVNFNPRQVIIHGNATGPNNDKYIIVGCAQFGQSLYLQPNTTTSVKPGGTAQTIIQSNTYFGGAPGASGFLHTIIDEGHIANIEFPSGTIFVRATITGYSNSGITLSVDTLASGWALNLSWTIS